MAGSYPDVPGRRLAYDADGTIGWQYGVIGSYGFESQAVGTSNWYGVNINSLVAKPNSHLIYGNDETQSTYIQWSKGGGSDTSYTNFCLIFPSPRDLYGWYWGLVLEAESVASGFGSVVGVETSVDTTNGIDGTWVSFSNPVLQDLWTSEIYYRMGVVSISSPGARAIRAIVYSQYRLQGRWARLVALHLYGSIATGYVPDQLLVVDATTGLNFAAANDWGDVPRGTTLDRTFKIKNNSATATANNITVSLESLTGTSHTWYTLKLGAGTFGSSVSITSLAAGALSDVITIRLAVPDTGDLSLKSARVKAIPTSWT